MLINFHHSAPKTICCVITADAEYGSIAIKREMVTTIGRRTKEKIIGETWSKNTSAPLEIDYIFGW